MEVVDLQNGDNHEEGGREQSYEQIFGIISN